MSATPTIAFRVSRSKKEQLEELASSKGMKVSEYVRHIVDEHVVAVDNGGEVWKQLRAVREEMSLLRSELSGEQG